MIAQRDKDVSQYSLLWREANHFLRCVEPKRLLTTQRSPTSMMEYVRENNSTQIGKKVTLGEERSGFI